jgi:hypothetical protein
MKKQSNLSAGGRKLSLNKKTISDLNEIEMRKKVGGFVTTTCHGHTDGGGGSRNGNTCPGHNTCYTC